MGRRHGVGHQFSLRRVTRRIYRNFLPNFVAIGIEIP